MTGLKAAAPRELLPWISAIIPVPDTPPQNLKEYDAEWGRAFWTGTVAASCDHARMLSNVKVPVLLTHHFRRVDEATGLLMGALSDAQAPRAARVRPRAEPTIGNSGHDSVAFERLAHFGVIREAEFGFDLFAPDAVEFGGYLGRQFVGMFADFTLPHFRRITAGR